MPMNMSPGEQKRAKNIIWTVAEDYSVDPAFVSADEKSRADFYLNLIVGSHSDRGNKKNYEELRKKFGDEIEERQRIKEKESHACTGIHKENRLFFAGAQIDSPRYIKNKNFYTKNKQVYDSLSCKLQEKLKTALAHRYSEEHVCTDQGI